MADKKKYEKFLTPKGELVFPCLYKPESFEGKVTGFSVMVRLSEKDEKVLKDRVEAVFAEAQKDPAFFDKAGQPRQWLPLGNIHKVLKDGTKAIKFRCPHEFTDKKTGANLPWRLDVFDAKMNPIYVPNIASGTIGKVSYSLRPYYKTERSNGVSLRLEAVQVLDLHEFGGGISAKSYGFSEEEGYEGDQATANDGNVEFVDELPF